MDRQEALAGLIEHQTQPLLATWRSLARELPNARNLDVPTLNDHIPYLLKELAAALRSETDQTIVEALLDGSPPAHGLQRVSDGFEIEEVVSEYNLLRSCIHDLADQNGIVLQGGPFHVLNRLLDGAIGSAMESFASQKALEVRRRREEYLAFVAHDLRTPLSAISLAARVLELLLAAPAVDMEKVALMLATVNRNVKYVEKLVGKVIEDNTSLDSESGIKLERREFELWPLVESLVLDLHPVASKSSTRLTNAVPHDFLIYADASLLRRVLQNLISNAINYSPEGEVVIGARDVKAGGTTGFFVCDNGEGMTEERCRSVFDKHDTDPDKVGGLGLGLAIVKMLVEAHDGTVTLESKPSVGSTFHVMLPARQP